MKNKYSKKQIIKAINHWKNILNGIELNESIHFSKDDKIQYLFFSGEEALANFSQQDLRILKALRYGLYKEEKKRWAEYGLSLDSTDAKSSDSLEQYLSECDFVEIVRANGILIGFGTASKDNTFSEIIPGNIYLDEGALNPSYIGSGIELESVNKFLEFLRGKGYSKFITSVDINNKRNDVNMRSAGFIPWQIHYIAN